jgi:hypothetical protein
MTSSAILSTPELYAAEFATNWDLNQNSFLGG